MIMINYDDTRYRVFKLSVEFNYTRESRRESQPSGLDVSDSCLTMSCKYLTPPAVYWVVLWTDP